MRAADRSEWGGEDRESAEEENEITYFCITKSKCAKRPHPCKEIFIFKNGATRSLRGEGGGGPIWTVVALSGCDGCV